MRQIHCLDRLSALVNKGPYHAQGLFSIIITTSAKTSRVSKKIKHVAAIECRRWVTGKCFEQQQKLSRQCQQKQQLSRQCQPGQRAKSIRTEARTRDLSRVRRAS